MDDVRLPEFEVYDGDGVRTHSRRSAQSGRVEFITRGDRRRVWAAEQKRAIALESLDPSTTPTDVARRYGISSGLLYTWRRQLREGQLGSAPQRLPRFARVGLVVTFLLEVPIWKACDFNGLRFTQWDCRKFGGAVASRLFSRSFSGRGWMRGLDVEVGEDRG